MSRPGCPNSGNLLCLVSCGGCYSNIKILQHSALARASCKTKKTVLTKKSFGHYRLVWYQSRKIYIYIYIFVGWYHTKSIFVALNYYFGCDITPTIYVLLCFLRALTAADATGVTKTPMKPMSARPESDERQPDMNSATNQVTTVQMWFRLPE